MWFRVMASLFAFLNKVFTKNQGLLKGYKCLHKVLPLRSFPDQIAAPNSTSNWSRSRSRLSPKLPFIYPSVITYLPHWRLSN